MKKRNKEQLMDFAKWLDKQLYDQRMSPADLARASGLSEGVISNLRNSKRQPTPRTLNKIAAGLKKSPLEVFQRAGLLSEDDSGPSAFDRACSEMQKNTWDSDN